MTKRIVSMVLAVVIVCLSMCCGISADSSSSLSVSFTADYALKLLQTVVGKHPTLTQQEQFSADLNQNGTVDAGDALHTLKIAVGKEEKPTPEILQSELLGVSAVPAVRFNQTVAHYDTTTVSQSFDQSRRFLLYWFDDNSEQMRWVQEMVSQEFYNKNSLLIWIDVTMHPTSIDEVTVQQMGYEIYLSADGAALAESAGIRVVLVAVPKTQATELRVGFERIHESAGISVQYFNAIAPHLQSDSDSTTLISDEKMLKQYIQGLLQGNDVEYYAGNHEELLLPGMAHRFVPGFFDKYFTIVCRVPGPRFPMGYDLAEQQNQNIVLNSYKLLPDATDGQLGGIISGDELVFIDVPRSEISPSEYKMTIKEAIQLTE